MQARYRRVREQAYEDGRHSFSSLAADPTFRDFLCLYIAEGSSGVAIESRSPTRIPRSFGLAIAGSGFASNPIRYAIQYHADQDLLALTSFWGNELDILPTTIRLQRKSNSGELTGRTLAFALRGADGLVG